MYNIIDVAEKNEFINWLQIFVIDIFTSKQSLILIYISDLELFLINFINIIYKH